MKIYKILIVCTLGTALGGCGDFLERSAQDLYVPTTTEHYANILRGEAYFQSILRMNSHVAMMTDDVEWLDINKYAGFEVTSYSPDSRKASHERSYIWQDEIENENYSDNGYQHLYKQVQIATICLEYVEGSDGTQDEKDILRGQASFTRAFAYLMLANLYAQPYNKAKPEDPCVPAKLVSTPTTDKFARATIKEIYDIILSDIGAALAGLKGKTIPNLYEINYPAALMLAARTALYMEDWDGVIRYGEEFLTYDYPLYDITGFTKATNSTKQTSDKEIKNFISSDNTEIVWCFGDGKGYSEGYYTMLYNFTNFACGGFRMNGPKPIITTSGTIKYEEGDPTGTFIGIYDYDFAAEEGDRRLPYWFMRPLWKYNSYVSKISNYVSLKWDYVDDDLKCNFAFRSAEVYLMLAEAYARKPSPDMAKSVGYLNSLREKRIAPYTALTVSDFANAEELAVFVWEERRRELCCDEFHRWWDLRRTTQPRIEHWLDNVKYVLAQGDKAYVLNFPIAERAYNGQTLGQNQRDYRSPE